MFRVELATSPRRFYAGAERPLASKLARCFSQLETDPRRHNNIKPLKGAFVGLHRFRVGDWRVVYRIDDARGVVYVLDIAHRCDIYE